MRSSRRYDLLSGDECERIVALTRSLPHEEAETIAGRSVHRSSQVVWLTRSPQTAWIFDRFESWGAAYAARRRLDVVGLHEFLQVARYESSHHFDWHVDVDYDDPAFKKVTMVAQLTDGRAYVGGDLELVGNLPSVFHRLQGSAVAFPSILAHRVLPVVSGVRYSIVGWMNGPPFR